MLAEYGLRGDSGVVSWERARGAEAAVDLVCRHLDEPAHTRGARRLEQPQRPDDVHVEERLGRQDAAIDVALGREVHDGLDLVTLQRVEHRRAVADISAHEDVSGVALEVTQVLEVACIREGIDVDELVGGPLLADEARVARADESRAAGDEQVHGHRVSFIEWGSSIGSAPPRPRR